MYIRLRSRWSLTTCTKPAALHARPRAAATQAFYSTPEATAD